MSKRKAYNPKKRLALLAKSALKGQAVIWIGGTSDGNCNMVDLRNHQIYAPHIEIARAVESGLYPWAVFCAVFCRDQQGQEYMKGKMVVADIKCKQSEIAEAAEGVHTQILRNDCNRQHVANVGWIAVPTAGDIDEETAGKIFDKANAWEFLSKWEASQEGVI
jgi:hypothetical protein